MTGSKALSCSCPRFRGEAHGHVGADDLERDLVHDLRNDRIDLAGHDGRSRLTGGRLISPRPARGPEDSSRRSLQTLESFTAIRFSTPESCT